MSQAPSREAVHLEDYRPPAYTTRDVHLAFALDPEATTVTATQQIERNPKAEGVRGRAGAVRRGPGAAGRAPRRGRPAA